MKNSPYLLVALLLLPNLPVQAETDQLTKATTDFSRPEPSERYPGGATTYTGDTDQQAYSHPADNMAAARKLDFTLGKAMFKRLWVSAPTATQAADGLGPLFNARSCLQCHRRNGRGRPEDAAGNVDVSLVLHLGRSMPGASAGPDPVYGHQLQTFAVRGIPAEGEVQVEYQQFDVTLSDGERVSLRKPVFRAANLAYGPLHPDTGLSPRLAPQMIGLGLLGAIREEDLVQLADPLDRDGDGISGKVNRVWSRLQQREVVGRFGWKASVPSVDEQSQKAFFHDIGISVPLFPQGAGECSEHQRACLEAPNGNSPQYDNLEAHSDVTRWTALYARNLAVPQRRDPDDPQVLRGKALFHQSGCVACHTPSFVTATESVDGEHSGQLIWPYTDLLLHDMGEGLSDNRPEGKASGREWRTAPLWGIGLSGQVNGNSYYLHDGRARSLLEAILWHGGEAAASREKVVAMSRSQRNDLIRFIESL